jgi:hypothetical protein
MPELPCTCAEQDSDLSYAVPHGPGIGGLAQVPVVLFPLTLVLLFAADILELGVEVADLSCEFGDVGPVVLDVGFCGADDDVEVEADVGVTEPGGVVGGEADGVVACLVGGEGESAVEGPDGADNDVT